MYNESFRLNTDRGAAVFHAHGLSGGFPRREPVPLAAAPGPDWLPAVLDEIDYGLVVLAPSRTLLHANRAARLELQQGKDVTVAGGHVLAVRDADDRALGSAVRAATARGLRRFLMIGGEPARLAVAVLPSGPVPGGESSRALLLMSRREVCEGLSVSGFARHHGLTPAEARVLAQLCQGVPASRIAEGQGIALSTVRTHITSIRLKTRAESIQDLLLRMARLPPMLNALCEATGVSAAA